MMPYAIICSSGVRQADGRILGGAARLKFLAEHILELFEKHPVGLEMLDTSATRRARSKRSLKPHGDLPIIIY